MIRGGEQNTMMMITQCDKNALTLKTDTFQLERFSPRAVYLVGQEERTLGGGAAHSAVRREQDGLIRYEFVWQAPDGVRLCWRVTWPDAGDWAEVSAAVYNGMKQTLRLKEISLIKTNGSTFVCNGEAEAWTHSGVIQERRVGRLSEILPSANRMEEKTWEGYGLPLPQALPEGPRFNDGRFRTTKDFFLLYNDGDQGVTIGPWGTPAAYLRFDVLVDGTSLAFDAVSEMTRVAVLPGEERGAQDIRLWFGPCTDSLRQCMEGLAVTHGARKGKKALTGWCSWYRRGQEVTRREVTDTIRGSLRHRERLNLDVIQLDDGWQKQVGDWSVNDRFGGSLDDIVEGIRETGAMPGIWLSPLLVNECLGIPAAHLEWFQRTQDGEFVGGSCNWGHVARWLDPTHPEARAFIRSMIREQKEKGFLYFKIDFNFIMENTEFYDQTKTALQIFRDLYALYREELGEECYLLSCCGFNRGSVGYADASRIGPDSCYIWKAPHPCNLVECIQAAGMTALANGVLYHNDPDVSYLGERGTFNPVGYGHEHNACVCNPTPEQRRIWHSIVGLLGGLELVSDTLYEDLDEDRLRMFEIIGHPAKEKGISLLQGRDLYSTRFGFYWSRPFCDCLSLNIWNPGPDAKPAVLEQEITAPLGEDYHVWSFWDGAYLGRGKEALACSLPPDTGLTVRLTRFREEPVTLVGSDLHISMGAAEIEAYSLAGDELEICLGRSGARDGKLYFFCPEVGLSLISAENCRCGAPVKNGDIWTVPVTNRNKQKEQRVRLAYSPL